MPSKKSRNQSAEIDNKKSPSETIEKDQDDLVSTLESIRGLLEQSENKLNAARESISIANANTKHDTNALQHMRTDTEEVQEKEIVPILDQIIEPELSDSLSDIPELDSVIEIGDLAEETVPEKSAPDHSVLTEPEQEPLELDIETAPLDSDKEEQINRRKENLAALTQKNLLIDALDNFQTDLELSLREDLMKTMVSLEKNLKEKISLKIERIKEEILK